MRATRMARRISLLELKRLTGIKVSRLSELEGGRGYPTSHERSLLVGVLGIKIGFAPPEEAEKRKEQMMESLTMIGKVIEEIDRRGFKKGKGGSGRMGCPKCGNTLLFSVSSYNGHRHAVCRTKGCIHFME